MTFWAILLALAWDRISPLSRPSQFERLYDRYAAWVVERFNAGSPAHGLLAWGSAVLPPALAVTLAGAMLSGITDWLGLAWAAATLYFCLGFQQTANVSRGIVDALRRKDPGKTRERLRDWGVPLTDVEDAELAGLAMGEVLRQSLGRLFGVLFWFVLLGPFGAVAYALGRLLNARCAGDSEFHAAVGRLGEVLDWLPSRLLAFSFALVGSFDGAMTGWRPGSRSPAPSGEEVARWAGTGALGLPSPAGETPGAEYVQGAVRLVLRAALLWLGVLGLLWLGGL